MDHKTLVVPQVNMNGDTKAELLAIHTKAWRAMFDALAKMHETAPHGRNFQTLGDRAGMAFREAVAQHRDRLERAQALMTEYQAIIQGIDGQGAGR